MSAALSASQPVNQQVQSESARTVHDDVCMQRRPGGADFGAGPVLRESANHGRQRRATTAGTGISSPTHPTLPKRLHNRAMQDRRRRRFQAGSSPEHRGPRRSADRNARHRTPTTTCPSCTPAVRSTGTFRRIATTGDSPSTDHSIASVRPSLIRPAPSRGRPGRRCRRGTRPSSRPRR